MEIQKKSIEKHFNFLIALQDSINEKIEIGSNQLVEMYGVNYTVYNVMLELGYLEKLNYKKGSQAPIYKKFKLNIKNIQPIHARKILKRRSERARLKHYNKKSNKTQIKNYNQPNLDNLGVLPLVSELSKKMNESPIDPPLPKWFMKKAINTVWNTDFVKEEIFPKISDDHLITEIKKRGYNMSDIVGKAKTEDLYEELKKRDAIDYTDIPDDKLIEELKRRGYSGSINYSIDL
mgnify:CR=1 FL=1